MAEIVEHAARDLKIFKAIQAESASVAAAERSKE